MVICPFDSYGFTHGPKHFSAGWIFHIWNSVELFRLVVMQRCDVLPMGQIHGLKYDGSMRNCCSFQPVGPVIGCPFSQLICGLRGVVVLRTPSSIHICLQFWTRMHFIECYFVKFETYLSSKCVSFVAKCKSAWRVTAAWTSPNCGRNKREKLRLQMRPMAPFTNMVWL